MSPYHVLRVSDTVTNLKTIGFEEKKDVGCKKLTFWTL